MSLLIHEVKARFSQEDGGAIVEFVALAIPLFIPIFIYLNSFSSVSANEQIARSMAREVLRVYVISENISIRFVADSDKHSLGGYFFFSPVGFNNSDAGHPGMISKYFIDLTMPFDFYFTLRDFSHETVNQNRLGSKFIAAMNDCDFFGNSGEVEGLFDCSVTAPDHANILVFIEKPIASCTG